MHKRKRNNPNEYDDIFVFKPEKKLSKLEKWLMDGAYDCDISQPLSKPNMKLPEFNFAQFFDDNVE